MTHSWRTLAWSLTKPAENYFSVGISIPWCLIVLMSYFFKNWKLQIFNKLVNQQWKPFLQRALVLPRHLNTQNRSISKITSFFFFPSNQNCLQNIGRDFCFIRNEDTMATIRIVCILAKKPIFHWTKQVLVEDFHLILNRKIFLPRAVWRTLHT